MKCSVGYIIKRGILVTLDTYNKFIEDVHNIPFIGKDGRQSPSYYLDIQRFLQHLICNNFLYAKKPPEDNPWTQYSPIYNELGKRNYRLSLNRINTCVVTGR